MARRLKVAVIGPYGVGKSTLIISYIQNEYMPNQEATIGASFFTKTYTFDSPEGAPLGANKETASLTIWDTAGAERYKAIMPMYIRDAHCILMCFDVPDLQTIEENIRISKLTNTTASIVLVATKLDEWYRDVRDIYDSTTPDGTKISWVPTQANLEKMGSLWVGIKQHADAFGYNLIFTSTIKNINVEHTFEVAANLAHEVYSKNYKDREKNMSLESKKSATPGSCC